MKFYFEFMFSDKLCISFLKLFQFRTPCQEEDLLCEFNLETEMKLNKARHTFSNEVFLSMATDFQLIPSEDARK